MVWHGDATVPASDLIVLPGGFSYGDYLRCGAMAAHSPIMRDVIAKAKAGTPVLGICNGFQVLCESGLLPGVLMRNASLKFICRDVTLRVEQRQDLLHQVLPQGSGRAPADRARRGQLLRRRRRRSTASRAKAASCSAIAMQPARPRRKPIPTAPSATSPASATRRGRILGLMPHPERLFELALGGTDGRRMIESALVSALEPTA